MFSISPSIINEPVLFLASRENTVSLNWRYYWKSGAEAEAELGFTLRVRNGQPCTAVSLATAARLLGQDAVARLERTQVVREAWM